MSLKYLTVDLDPVVSESHSPPKMNIFPLSFTTILLSRRLLGEIPVVLGVFQTFSFISYEKSKFAKLYLSVVESRITPPNQNIVDLFFPPTAPTLQTDLTGILS